MKSIEFFGPPGSGKTYYQKKLRKFLINNNFKTYSFEENFYTNYSKINEIGFLNQIKFFLKSKLTDENNYILKLTMECHSFLTLLKFTQKCLFNLRTGP